LKEVILYLIYAMSYKCFILTKKKHFRAYNAPPSGALVLLMPVSASMKVSHFGYVFACKLVSPKLVKLHPLVLCDYLT
jgi:hypothetical protein